jgi:hypothetical protein
MKNAAPVLQICTGIAFALLSLYLLNASDALNRPQKLGAFLAAFVAGAAVVSAVYALRAGRAPL